MAKKSKPTKKAKARTAAPAKKAKVAAKPVKSVKPIPDGYHTITPYIILDDAAKAIEFYQKAFGARERMRMPGPGGKIVHAWAVESDFDPSSLKSNEFEIEWPPNSGKRSSFPEVDRAEWFDLAAASKKILASQEPILQHLVRRLTEMVEGG